MSAFKPGIGDPLGFENPYRDGRPNWNLQTKRRVFGPNDNLRGSMQIQEPRPSPYAQDFPDKYTRTERLDSTSKGRHHFDHHLATTTNEWQDRGVGVPEHLVSGWDKPDRARGRMAVPPQKHVEKSDGGVWEPVARQYPKVPKIERPGGTKIVAREPKAERNVDIWPCTLTVKDHFKPGGLRMFEGRRATNKAAFPGAIGYTPPKTWDEQGRMIDYSSVHNGGPFGKKMVHDNDPTPVPAANPEAWRTTRTEQSARKQEEAQRRAAFAPTESFFSGAGTRDPHAKSRRPATLPPRDSARAGPAAPMSATTSGDNSLARASLAPSRPAGVDLQVQHGRRASRGGSRRSSVAQGGSSVAQGGSSVAQGGASGRREEATTGKTHTPPVFTAMYRPNVEHPLTASTAWTFMGGYRP